MPSEHGGVACPTPEPKKREKARGKRAEQKVEQAVRAACVLRDGDCRLQGSYVGYCGGESEWAHMPDKRRSKTRGQEPEVRHTTAGSLMLCSLHHALLDTHRMTIEAMTEQGADSTLRIVKDGVSVLSIPKGTA
jgi:hypothetical protein